MHHYRHWILGSIVLLSVSFMAGCSSSSGGTGTYFGGGAVKMVVNAANYGARRGFTATNTNNGYDGVSMASMGILSGPPLAMVVYLQSVALTVSNGAPVTVYTSTASNTSGSGFSVTGCPIALTNGNPDLSGCSGLNPLTVPAGTYTGLQLTFAEVGDIQGCLNGAFQTVVPASQYTNTLGTSNPNTFYYPTGFPQTFFAYQTDPDVLQALAGPSHLYTFCTRQDKSYFNAETASMTAIGNDDDYQPTPVDSTSNTYFTGGVTSPQFVSIDLGSGNQNNSTMAVLKSGSVTINSTSVPTTSTATLTLAVDMNRMLEFFANVRNDFNPPNPDFHTGTSYFFTTKFSATGGQNAVSALHAFAGDVGSVEGYQLTATMQGQSSPAASGWFTLYLDASGNYIGGSFYEDDDNELTIMKGNAMITSGTLATGATISLDIAGTITGFTSTAPLGTGNATGTATSNGSPVNYTLAYKRLL